MKNYSRLKKMNKFYYTGYEVDDEPSDDEEDVGNKSGNR